VNEAEQFVRAMVCATGEPVLLAPPVVRVRLLAIPLHWLVEGDEGIFTLFPGPEHPESDDEWMDAMRNAHDEVRRWTSASDIPGVLFIGLGGRLRRIEADSLGISLLQLHLNWAGSQIALQLWA